MVRDTPADEERLERTPLVHLSLAEANTASRSDSVGWASRVLCHRVPDNAYGRAVRNIAREQGVDTAQIVWQGRGLGAGTVLDAETANAAIQAGAGLIVSPTLDMDVIRLCNHYGAVAAPGCYTPTEMLAACDAGADLQVFPGRNWRPGDAPCYPRTAAATADRAGRRRHPGECCRVHAEWRSRAGDRQCADRSSPARCR